MNIKNVKRGRQRSGLATPPRKLQSSAVGARNKPMIETVIEVFCVAFMQALGEFSLLDDGNRILDGRFIPLPDI